MCPCERGVVARRVRREDVGEVAGEVGQGAEWVDWRDGGEERGRFSEGCV